MPAINLVHKTDDSEILRRRFLANLHAALRVARLYPSGNSAVKQTIETLQRGASRLFRTEGDIELVKGSNGLLLNHDRLKADLTNHAIVESLTRQLERVGIDQLTIRTSISSREWSKLIRILATSDESGEHSVEELLSRNGVTTVQTGSLIAAASPEEKRESAKNTYLKATRLVGEAMCDFLEGRRVAFRSLKRVVQSVVDQVRRNETAMVANTTRRDAAPYATLHAVNVCVLSVLLGHRLGLDKHMLYELGMCGLLHDVGKLQMPQDILEKEDPLTAQEWQALRHHPREGLLLLGQIEDTEELPLRTFLAAYEHHMKRDLSGYPEILRPRQPGLFSRIVSLVDVYDAITSPRGYRSRPWPPDKVLRNMRDEPAWGQDTVLVKAFISVMGIYPIGTVVLLDNGCLAVITNANVETPHTPVLRVITDEHGKEIAGEEHDLAVPRPGAPKIVRSIDANRYGIDPSSLI